MAGNKQTTVQVETILVPQQPVTEGGCSDGNTKTSSVGGVGRYGCVRTVGLEQQGAIGQQTMRLSALSCEEQHETDSGGTGGCSWTGLVKEVEEEDNRGGTQWCLPQSTMTLGQVTMVQ